jgi:phage-related minor tail protein
MAIFQNAIKDIDTAIAQDLTNAIFEGENAVESLKATFKEAIKQMIADTIRLMVVQAALQSIFGFFGYSAVFAPSGGISNIEKKAMGGPVMKNKPYIVGEQGPELMIPGSSGNIVPNHSLGGMNQTVNYNIQAVDAPSFQSLVARDPQFLHAVVTKGANTLPSGRRF